MSETGQFRINGTVYRAEREVISAEMRRHGRREVKRAFVITLLCVSGFIPVYLYTSPIMLMAVAIPVGRMIYRHRHATRPANEIKPEEKTAKDLHIEQILREESEAFCKKEKIKPPKLHMVNTPGFWGHAYRKHVHYNLENFRAAFDDFGDSEEFRMIVRLIAAHEITHHHGKDALIGQWNNLVHGVAETLAFATFGEAALRSLAIRFTMLNLLPMSFAGISEDMDSNWRVLKALVANIGLGLYYGLSASQRIARFLGKQESVELRADLGAARANGLVETIDANFLADFKEELSLEKRWKEIVAIPDLEQQHAALRSFLDPKAPRGLEPSKEEYYPNAHRRIFYLMRVYEKVLDKEIQAAQRAHRRWKFLPFSSKALL